MTVLNFPASPSDGDTYTENGVVYTWNGSYWSANNASDLGNIYVAIAGDRMTGQLELPGGGGDTEALQRQEVQLLIEESGGGGGGGDLYWERDAGALSPKVSTDSIDIGDGNITLNAADGSGSFENTITAKEGCTVGTKTLGLDITLENSRKDVVYHAKTSSTDTRHLWRLNNIDRASIDYNGDMAIGITGSYTPSTPAISLNAAGSSEFNGNMQVNGRIDSAAGLKVTRAGAGGGYLSIGNSDTNCYSIYNGTETTSRSYYDGTLQIGGVLNSSSPTSTAPNISLNADGSSSFAQNATTNTFTTFGYPDTSNTEGKGARVRYTPSGSNGDFGQFFAQCAGSSAAPEDVPAFFAYNGTSQVAAINFDGSSQFAGDMAIGITGSYTPSTPAISLMADGSTDSRFRNNVSIGEGFAYLGGADGIQLSRRGYISFSRTNPDLYALLVYKTGDANQTVSITVGGDASFAGDIQSTSQNGAQIGGFRNQIINGDFRVWQRGDDITVPSGVDYTVDRWRSRGRSKQIAFQGMPSIRINDASKTYLYQPIELNMYGSTVTDPRFEVGTTWTLSYWCSEPPSPTTSRVVRFADGTSDTAAFTDVVTGGIPLPTATGKTKGTSVQYASTFTIENGPGADQTMLLVYVAADVLSTNTYFSQIQIEPGPVATPFEHRPYATELALCQRYYQRFTSEASGSYFGTGFWGGSNVKFQALNSGADFRTRPTIAFDGDIKIFSSTTGNSNYPVTNMGTMGKTGWYAGADTFTESAGPVCSIRFQTGAYVEFDCDL